MSDGHGQPSPSDNVLAAKSAKHSLKRARILFDGTASKSADDNNNDSSSFSSAHAALLPSVDKGIQRANIKRRIQSFYPVIPSNQDSLFTSSAGGGEGKKDAGTSLTMRIIDELRQETLQQLRSGAGGGGADLGARKREMNEGRIVLHREVDVGMGTGGAAAAVVAETGGGITTRALALPGQKVASIPSVAVTVTTTESSKERQKQQRQQQEANTLSGGGILVTTSSSSSKNTSIPTPKWHAPWRLSTVLSSHLGWVRSIAFDPTNDMFATGGADRVIKIFDLAKACVGADDALKITLTGHISPVRGLAFSDRHPYLFSAGEDKMVMCWDLETNQVIRHYHGHLSGVFALKLHPTLDLLVTGGRDAVARVWDMRTKTQVHCLTGHDNTVGALLTKSTDPQVITGSYDCTIKLWDLVAGKSITTLTHHKKSIRALTQPSFENTFLSGAADTLKKWQGRDGRFIQNFTGHNAIINALAMNDDGVVLSGADNGTMNFWDYSSGYCFQKTETIAQPGSLDAENGIFAAEFDLTGTRLVTGEADKTVKIWKQDEEASELSHPIDMAGWRKKCLAEAKQRY